MADGEKRNLLRLHDDAVSAITDEILDLALDLLDPTCKQLAEELRERCPGAVPVRLPPAGTAPPVTVAARHAAALYASAFTAAVQVPPAARAGSAVVWADGEHELMVYPHRVRVLFRDGFVLVGITVYTEQTGTAEVSVPFAVGSASAPAGLMIATEPLPRGPALVAERWGDQLIAAAWQALVHLTGGIAAAAGTDTGGAALIPAALTAAAAGLTVLPQATPGTPATAPPSGAMPPPTTAPPSGATPPSGDSPPAGQG
jgi:hypothetical protein